jgi:hypothetical protein
MRREALILAGLFAVLVAFIALGPGRSAGVLPSSNRTSHGSGPGGALALYRWLEGLDYDVDRLQYQAFAPDPMADLMIVLDPSERFTPEEAELVTAWVEDGGVLLVSESRAGAFGPARPLLEALELEVAALPEEQGFLELAPVLQPALSAPLALRLEAQTRSVLRTERDDVAPLAGAADAPVLVGLQVGEGYVYASSTAHPFINEGLADADNAALMLNILRRVPPGGRIVFDEYHHGFISEPSLRALLLGTPLGWATLYGAAAIAGYLLLTGRRFGKPIPLREEASRRSSAEYLESMAGLLRRAGKVGDAQEHFRASLKRRLARAHGLNPQLDDSAFVESLSEASPGQGRAAQAILARLATPVASEGELLRLVAEADALVQAA